MGWQKVAFAFCFVGRVDVTPQNEMVGVFCFFGQDLLTLTLS